MGELSDSFVGIMLILHIGAFDRVRTSHLYLGGFVLTEQSHYGISEVT